MRIICTSLLIFINIIVKSQDFGQVIFCGQEICKCKVYLKSESIETLIMNDIITYDKSLKSSLIIYYPEDTIQFAMIDSFDSRRSVYFLTSIHLIDARNCDGLTFTVSVMALYDGGSVVVDSPLKMRVDDRKWFLLDCND